MSAFLIAANEVDGLADEAIHLASALQLAGFRHMVRTPWEVSDQHSVDVARILYETLRDEGMTDEAVCRGLHFALRALRDGRAEEDIEDHAAVREDDDAEASDRTHAGARDGLAKIASDLEGALEASREVTITMTFKTSPSMKETSDFDWVPYVHYGA